MDFTGVELLCNAETEAFCTVCNDGGTTMDYRNPAHYTHIQFCRRGDALIC